MSQHDQNDKQSGLNWSTPPAGQLQKPASVPLAAKPAAPVATKPTTLAATEANRSAAKITGWLAVGVAVGVVVAWGATSLFKQGGAAGAADTQTATSTVQTDGMAVATGTELAVASSQKAGTSVAVSNVNVSEPTWVVVYESRNGTPGNVLGASLFFPGSAWGNVELLRSTAAGQTYFVTEWRDNGDHKFSLKEDSIITEDGQPSWASFTAN